MQILIHEQSGQPMVRYYDGTVMMFNNERDAETWMVAHDCERAYRPVAVEMVGKLEMEECRRMVRVLDVMGDAADHG